MKANTFRNDALKLIFQAVAIATIADNAATTPLANIQVALHTAFPGLAGDQTNSEVAYTGYARIPVVRSAVGWTVAANIASPAATISFGQCTNVTTVVATFFSAGVANSGASKILRMGVLGSRLGPFTAVAVGDIVTIPGLAAALAVNDRVVFMAVDGSTLPTGITEGTSYWVISVATNDITFSLTQGGAAVDVTAAGDGLVYKSTPITIMQNVTPQLTTASQIVEE